MSVWIHGIVFHGLFIPKLQKWDKYAQCLIRFYKVCERVLGVKSVANTFVEWFDNKLHENDGDIAGGTVVERKFSSSGNKFIS